MRRGCISLGEIHCDECQRIIPHSERYFAVEEENGIEAESGKTMRYCIECSLEKGYAYYKETKDEKVLTIFPQSEY
ncbi:hypothetical protein ACFLVC_04130 [Chloroflexota bacterium]